MLPAAVQRGAGDGIAGQRKMGRSRNVAVLRRRCLTLVAAAAVAGPLLLGPWRRVAAATPAPVAVGGPILLGQSADLSGRNAFLGQEFRRGAEACFQEVNARGGVRGRRIKLLSLDDSYDPAQALRNTETLLERDRVLALFGYVGTPTVQAALPLIERSGVPLIAPVTGAQLLRRPDQRMIVNIRASYHDEMAAMVRYLDRYRRRQIAVFYQQDGFGQDGLLGVRRAVQGRPLQIVATAGVPRRPSAAAVTAAARRIAAAQPEAVLLVVPYATAAPFIRQLRANGSDAQLISVSFVGSRALVQALPAGLRHGVGISQVVPFPWDARIPLVKDYQQAMRRANAKASYGFLSLEGYIAARVLVKALQEATQPLTRASLVEALRQRHGEDLGGFRLRLDPRSRNPPPFVQLTFLAGPNGIYLH